MNNNGGRDKCPGCITGNESKKGKKGKKGKKFNPKDTQNAFNKKNERKAKATADAQKLKDIEDERYANKIIDASVTADTNPSRFVRNDGYQKNGGVVLGFDPNNLRSSNFKKQ